MGKKANFPQKRFHCDKKKSAFKKISLGTADDMYIFSIKQGTRNILQKLFRILSASCEFLILVSINFDQNPSTY